MYKYSVLLCGFLLLATPDINTADDKASATGKDAVSPDKAFSDQLTDGYRGIDWSPWTALMAIENPEATPTAGKSHVSPDKRFLVQTTVGDREFDFVVKDTQTGSISRLTSTYCPIFSLEWSPDSKTILAVVHAAHTSFIDIIHWNGHAWLQFNIDAPGDYDNSHVVKWEFKTGYIKATYIVDQRTGNGKPLDLYRCTFDIDPTNGNVSEATNTPITLKEFVSLRTSLN